MWQRTTQPLGLALNIYAMKENMWACMWQRTTKPLGLALNIYARVGFLPEETYFFQDNGRNMVSSVFFHFFWKKWKNGIYDKN